VSTFAFIVGLGASLGLWRVVQHVPRWQAARWLNAGLLTLFCILAGARLDYVLFHAAYFAQNPLEAIEIWKGGLAWPGALVGALAAVVIVAVSWHIPFGLIADTMSPLAAPLAIAVWLGCWQAGCAYGPLIPASAWWGIPIRDETGAFASRLPLQALAALTLVIFFSWLEAKTFPRGTNGRLASLAALGLSLNLLIFSLLRVDPAPLWQGIRPDIWMAVGLTLVSLAACAYIFWPKEKELTHK
jgi:phosphatidylglycerol---prolipoprotein diacylglyceryl transferase